MDYWLENDDVWLTPDIVSQHGDILLYLFRLSEEQVTIHAKID